ncbi:MAG: TonB-dependent receptor [Paludibacteraceae bacterium]|nr:TonB-dependent receptor [Paludibacteraceae bacterium]
MKRIFLLTVSISVVLLSVSSTTLRGFVKDAVSGEELIGATVRIVETGAGAVADLDGSYVIEVFTPGRYTIEGSYVGYEPSIHKEILVAGTKDVQLDMELRERSSQLTEVVVRPRVNKESTVNPTSLVGGTMLSMEEANRYAGGYNDPARLVTAMAGVSGQGDGNGISVHGNAPQFMQYRIEGIEVFTPNHFNEMFEAGYGLVSALNSNVIGNSDFYTSTFNANYSNALSGVFDIKMRPGNSSKYENLVQIGTVSEEITSEGPISKKHHSSYILNYRYGFTSFADKIGILDAMGAQYDFQDFSLKLNFPTKKAGCFSLFTLGFWDKSKDERLDLDEVHSLYDVSNMDGKLLSMLVGASHKIRFGKKWTWRTTAAYNLQHLKTNTAYWGLQRGADNVLIQPIAYEAPLNNYPFSVQKQNEDRIVINTEISKQVTAKWLTQFGGEYSHRYFDLRYRSADDVYEPVTAIREYYSTKDNTGLASVFWSNMVTPSEAWSFNIGIASSYFLLSEDVSFEPRTSLKWQPNHRNSVSIGYGLHSMIEKLDAYFLRDDDGKLLNKDLGLSKAHHLMGTYMYKFTDNLNARINLYYQYGFDIPVGINGSTYCTVNRLFTYVDEPLVNKGNTRNYGADLTLEQYMSHGFFGQINATFCKSEYRGLDKKWRNQLYDRGYMFKILAGKEWVLGKSKKNMLNVSAKYTLQGGLRYTPIDMDAMKARIASGNYDDTPIYKDDEAMTKQFEPSHIVDLTISYRHNGKRVSHTIAFEGLNVLQNETPYAERYDIVTGKIRKDKSGISLPNFFYRLDF